MCLAVMFCPTGAERKDGLNADSDLRAGFSVHRGREREAAFYHGCERRLFTVPRCKHMHPTMPACFAALKHHNENVRLYALILLYSNTGISKPGVLKQLAVGRRYVDRLWSSYYD